MVIKTNIRSYLYFIDHIIEDTISQRDFLEERNNSPNQMIFMNVINLCILILFIRKQRKFNLILVQIFSITIYKHLRQHQSHHV